MLDSLGNKIHEGDTLYHLVYKVFGTVMCKSITSDFAEDVIMNYDSSIDYRWGSMYWRTKETIKIKSDNHKLEIMIKYGEVL